MYRNVVFIVPEHLAEIGRGIASTVLGTNPSDALQPQYQDLSETVYRVCAGLIEENDLQAILELSHDYEEAEIVIDVPTREVLAERGLEKIKVEE